MISQFTITLYTFTSKKSFLLLSILKLAWQTWLLLFLLYINDLPNCLSHSVPRMYADDTHLTYSNGHIYSIQSSLNEELRNINPN